MLKLGKNSKYAFGAILASLSLGVLGMGCGYTAPTTAEIYDPVNHADHRVDIASEESMVALYQIMKDTHEIFGKCGLPYWADSGTMLGAVRNGGIIPWDDDNDTGILKKDIPKFLQLAPAFEALGYKFEEIFFGYKIVDRNSTASLDVFVMVEEDGKYYYRNGEWGSRQNVDRLGNSFLGRIYLTHNELFPLKEVAFGPVKVNVPNSPNPYLDAMFRGWKDVAFTYGHAGQRKFKIDLNQYSSFKLPAPLHPETLAPIDVSHKIKDRLPVDFQCPQIDESRHNRIHIRPHFDGV